MTENMTSTQLAEYLDTQRLLALAAIIEACKDDESSREIDLKWAAIRDAKNILGA